VDRIFSKWVEGLSLTRQNTFGQIKTLFKANEITSETWEEIERLLVQSDVGINTTRSIIDHLKETVQIQRTKSATEFEELLRTELINRFQISSVNIKKNNKPYVIMIVGVNGSGKTTSVAKLAYFYKSQGKQVLIAAADTFRAAADEQINIWANRINVPVIKGEPGSDPGAVVFNALQSGIARRKDIIIIDTAGRLHTRNNLMDELNKIQRVCGKVLEGSPQSTWLVVDSITGQNALNQAKAFQDSVSINGVILAKMDLSARGGMAFAIHESLGIPIVFSGLGEKIDDLQPFSAKAYVKGLLGDK